MSFNWDGLYNPFFAWRCSTRDPAAIYHEGKYYIYVTIQFNQERWGAPEGYQIHMIETEDFRNFSNPVPVTPRGYVSPGNVIRANGKFYMSITRYPWPTAVSLIESDDLVHWSEPRIVVPTFHGDYWGNDAHGPIDGYLVEWRNRYWMFYTDYQKGTRSQHLGLAVSDDLVTFENLTPDKPLLDSDFYNENRGIENVSMVVDGDDLYLFCSVGMPEQSIAVLKSNDIMSWPKLDKSAEIGGLKQEWSKFVACAQFVADWREQNGYWTMLFMGTRHFDAHDRMMLGMARSKDLLNWEVLPEGVPEEEYLKWCENFHQRYLNGELCEMPEKK
ncbi:MAG: hypothetical protein E7056_04270 [Lentisphaerae bacterium]|nr:hypothetical protein [Lentisphaerota bacterium]